MPLPIPTFDGQVLEYLAVPPPNSTPRIYYVNGVRTDGLAHAQSANKISEITEHTVFGVYNATAGAQGIKGYVFDGGQCVLDWMDIFLSKGLEIGNGKISGAANAMIDFFRRKVGLPAQDPGSLGDAIRQKIPPAMRVWYVETNLSLYNLATLSLFRQLRNHLGERQMIVAHSQGNLITADALWSMVIAFGEASLHNMRVYSLASPAPAWPLGIRYRRKVYGYSNDVIPYADPHNWPIFQGGKFARTAGDWRQYGGDATPGLAAHDIDLNMALNFTNSIRRDLGLPPLSLPARTGIPPRPAGAK